MQQAWKIKARSVLRSMGVLGAIRKFQNRKIEKAKKAYLAEYEAKKPSQMQLPEMPMPIQFHPIDADHYADLMTRREPAVLEAILNVVKPGSVVWDIGANVGYFTVLFGKLVGETGQVVAFEPEPASHNEMLTNCRLNNLTNIHPMTVALGDAPATFYLKVNPNPHSGVHKMFADSAKGIPVSVVTAESLVKEGKAPAPNMAKIDVEGAEYKVLQGLRPLFASKELHTIIAEIHFAILESQGDGQVPAKIHQELKDAGFTKLTWLDASHLMAQK